MLTVSSVVFLSEVYHGVRACVHACVCARACMFLSLCVSLRASMGKREGVCAYVCVGE